MSALTLFDSPELLRPPLKWAGGKRWLVPRLKELVHGQGHRRFVEPFVGGLGVTLGLTPRKALLNDANRHLIAFYKWLQTGLSLQPSDVLMENTAECFQANRVRFNALIDQRLETSREAAMLFYYLNRTCFNGLCRFNSRGYFNVPFGRYKTIRYRETFVEYKEALRPHTFLSGDFSRIPINHEDLVYADPPYDVDFTSYSAGGFDWDDQVRLADWLARHDGPVIVSNQGTERIQALYRSRGFYVELISAPRRISCDGNRDDAVEIVATRGL